MNAQRKPRTQETCTCKAYPFPHRLGGGECNREEVSGPYCRDCGSNDVRMVDNGIGPFEYWGSRGVHHDWQPECHICGSDNIEGKVE